jgi:hypothetical protein
MATITILDGKSANSIYNAADAAYDAKIAINARKIERVHESMRYTMQCMNRELNRAYLQIVIARYFESLDHTSCMHYDRTMRSWSQYLHTWCMELLDAIEYYNDAMDSLENDLASNVESLAQLHHDRSSMLPETIERSIERARVYIPVSSTVLKRGTRSFVVSVDTEDDQYRIAIRTMDSQVKIYNSARMHNAASTAIKMVDKLIALKYTIANGACTAMVIDRVDGTCSMRTMVDQGCIQTIDQIRKLARIEAKNVLPYIRIKRSWYTLDSSSDYGIQHAAMPQCRKDACSIIMVRKTMHGKHVQAIEYAMPEDVLNHYGIAIKDQLFYELQLPRDIVRMRKDSHGESIAFDTQTIDTIKLYLVDQNDARIENLIAGIKLCKRIA